jgi:hypothetical protein
MINPRLRVLLITLKVATATFITGNVVAALMGALPITFTPISMSQEETRVIENLKLVLDRIPGEPVASENLALIEFLHNDLSEARAVINAVPRPFGPSLETLDAALRTKEAGSMLDLAFGQRKLARLREALDDLSRLAEANPADTGVQILVLSTLASVTKVDDTLLKAQQLNAILTPRLEQEKLPVELLAAGLLAVAKTETATADTANTKEAMVALERRSAALARFDSLTGLPSWLTVQRAALKSPGE